MSFDVAAAVHDVVHDLRSSLGSIRLVLTSVLDEPDDALAEVRPLLVGAEEETRRLAAALGVVPALVDAGADGAPGAMTLAHLLETAAAEARRRGVHLVVDAADGHVLAPPRSAAGVLATLCALVADTGAAVTITGAATADAARITIARTDGRATRLGAASVRHLAAALGATVEEGTDALTLRIPSP